MTVTDDKGREVHLEAPARRIISLAPHITENLFAVGAGDQIVGTVNYSDYPQAAEDIPRVGSYKQLDLESILALEPDLVVAWESGNVRAQLERLEALGYPLYFSNPQTFEQLASGLARLGRLSGHVTGGEEAETQVRHTLAELEDRYGQQPPVTVFYQVWDRPLMTLNEEHLISQAIHLCGGENIFGHLDTLVPRLNREVILAADPEAIIGGGMGEDNPQWVEDWRRWSDMTAVQRDNLFFIPPSLIQRPTPRILEGTRMICDFLETARERRPEGDE
ncbi:iron complex transport system substrate-binding protein [Ectothiorhodospira marina]|uniref:Iron complex transport system substrate-binding protein n=1 Tax=Ectothiorhodospira marina TaxID=1396821 RepID=A0A1H7FDP8_9GAMM|nr:cobalamin-binding protein [Ectothiorhodospira marina]SEK23864.1 iron complex transport system substrate-binding protein [Ectothiorhodospira marina]